MRQKADVGAGGRAMPGRRSETCYGCRFWVGHGFKERGPKGSCRRFPPTVTPRHPDGTFPVTAAHDWCGEWQRASARSTDPDSPTETDARTIYDELDT